MISLKFEDDGKIPNHPDWPLLMYRGALAGFDAAAVAERFQENGWDGCWVNGVYPFHHYHAETHEVLGCVSGSAEVRFGGESGETVRFEAGDAVIIPAGVGHKRLQASEDFSVVGAYPGGKSPDMQRGEPDQERPAVLESIRSVARPENDPVFGEGGPLLTAWK